VCVYIYIEREGGGGGEREGGRERGREGEREGGRERDSFLTSPLHRDER